MIGVETPVYSFVVHHPKSMCLFLVHLVGLDHHHSMQTNKEKYNTDNKIKKNTIRKEQKSVTNTHE